MQDIWDPAFWYQNHLINTVNSVQWGSNKWNSLCKGFLCIPGGVYRTDFMHQISLSDRNSSYEQDAYDSGTWLCNNSVPCLESLLYMLRHTPRVDIVIWSYSATQYDPINSIISDFWIMCLLGSANVQYHGSSYIPGYGALRFVSWSSLIPMICSNMWFSHCHFWVCFLIG